MKIIYYFLIILPFFAAFGESFQVRELNFDNIPEISTEFYLFDDDYESIIDLTASDFTVFENGVQRNVTDVTCPPEKIQKISSTLVIDISGSMKGNKINGGKEAANLWVDLLGDGSECSIVGFNDYVYVNQSFTTDKELLKEKITYLAPDGGTNYNPALLKQKIGAIDVTKKGKYKKVIVYITK